MTPGQREELRKEYKDEGILNFDEQTAQVRLRPSALSFTDSHSIETIVRKPPPIGEFNAFGSYLKRLHRHLCRARHFRA